MGAIYKTVTISREEIDDDICNKCRKSLWLQLGEDENSGNFEGLTETTLYAGYGSKLGDGNVYRFSLCEDCLIEFFGTFQIDPLQVDD
jgi:hypothetical protein